LSVGDALLATGALDASATGNTVNYNGGGAQTIKATTYHNLTLSNAGAKSGTTALTVNGDFTIDGTATFTAGAATHNFYGNWIVNTSAATPITVTTTSAMNFNTPAIPAVTSISGTAAATLEFADLNANNTSGFDVNSNIGFQTGTSPTLSVASGVTLTPDPTVVISGTTGTLMGSGTVKVTRMTATPDFLTQFTINTKTLTALEVDYDATAAQTVNPLNYSTLTISGNRGGSTVTLDAGTAGVSVAFNPNASNVTYATTGNTVNFNGTVAETIPAFDYNNLTSSSTGGRTLASSGTVGVAGTFTPGANAYAITGSTIDFNGTGSQTIPAFDFNNLRSSSTGDRTLASSGTIGVAGVFTPGSNAYTITGSTVDFNGGGSQTISAFDYNNLTSSSTGARTLASSGTIGVAAVFTPGANTYTVTGSTVDFNGSGAQSIPVFSYDNLTVSGTRTTNSVTLASGTINIAGNLANTASFTSGGVVATGNTVVFDGAGTQSITGTQTTQTFNNLTVNKSSGTLTVTGSTTALDLSGDFSLASGTFTAPTTMTIAGAVALSSPGGTWNAGSTTNVAGDWTNDAGTFTSGDGTVVMNGSSAQTVGGTQSTTFRSLTIQNAAGVSLTNTITLSKNPPSAGNLTISSGTLSDGGHQITGNDLGSVTIASGAGLTLGTPASATLFPTNYLTVNVHIASTITYNSGLAQSVFPVPSPGYGIIAFGGGGTKTLTGALLARGGLSIGANTTLDDAGYQITGASGYPMTMAANSALILGNSTTATSFPTGFTTSDITLTSPSTITYSSNQPQVISEVPNYRTLSLQSTAAVTKTTAAAITTDNLTIGSNNTLDGAGYVITVNNDVTNSGVYSGTGSGRVRLAGSLAQQLGGNGTFYKLQLANTAGATLTGSPTISDSLVLTTGNLTVGANTLILNGPALDSAETKIIAGATSSFVFGGVEDTLYLPKNISALNNLEVNMGTTDGKLNHSAPMTINGTLTLTLGMIDLFQYPNPPVRVDTLTIASTGSINIIGGRVKGGLRRWVPVNAGTQTISWPVGGADVKTQADIAFTNVTTAGWLTIRMFASDHPLINSSGINPTKSVNRYWTMRNSGIAYTSTDVTLNYAGTSDIDAGANWNDFAVSRYNPLTASWLPLSVGTRTPTSTEATGSTLFGDFQVGELGEKVWTGAGDGTSWGNASNWSPAGVPTNIHAVKIRSAANISITTAATANSIVMNNSGLTLTIGTTGSLTITSDLTDSTGTLNTQAAFPAVGGTVSLLGGTVGYTAAGAQNVSTQSYNNLSLSGGGAKTFAGTTNIAGDFTIGGTATATTTGTTIVFNGTIAQAIAATTYENLTINGSGTKTLASGATAVDGALTLTAGQSTAAARRLLLQARRRSTAH